MAHHQLAHNYVKEPLHCQLSYIQAMQVNVSLVLSGVRAFIGWWYARCVDWSMGMVTRGRDKLRAAERFGLQTHHVFEVCIVCTL